MSQLKNKKNKSFTVEKNYNHGYCTRRNLVKKCDTCKEYEERIATLQNALKDVLNQNDALRSRVVELEAVISAAEDELCEKEEIIKKLHANHN